MREKASKFKDWREARRFRAWELKQKGWKQSKIAEALGVTKGAVSQWIKQAREGGVEALHSRRGGGPKPRLTEEQLKQLPELLDKGPEAYRFRGDVWTRARVGEVIKQEFGVTYTPTHVGRLLDKIGWTRQKPMERASQRDEEAIEQWRTEEWNEIEEKAKQEGRTIVFVDEAGFYLLPAAVRTYAPCGETPILRYPYWEHLSVISAITPQGKLYTMTQEESFKGPDIARFLKHLLRHIPGKLLVIWDRLPAHRSHYVKNFLREGATKRLHLEQLPSYAPDLNPDEGVWHYLKNVEMKNLCCHDLDELCYELRKAIARLRHKEDVILSFIRQVHLGDKV